MTTVADLVDSYVADPGPRSFEAVRRAVRSAPDHRPGLVPAEVLGPLQRADDHAGVVQAATALMPGAALSPSVHLALAHAYAELGRQAESRHEVAVARAAVRGMLGSGDGTRTAPWRVLRLSDEYDVLRALRARSVGQSLVAEGEAWLDRHETESGATYYFDVTGLV